MRANHKIFVVFFEQYFWTRFALKEKKRILVHHDVRRRQGYGVMLVGEVGWRDAR